MALVLGVACSGDDDPPPEAAPQTTSAAGAALGPGEGVAVIGGEELLFDVTACEEGAAAADPPEATRESAVVGEGEADGSPFTVEVTRYRSDTGTRAAVVTETARLLTGEGDAALGIEAKRTTAGVDGAWLDLTDPDATEPLIDRRSDRIEVEGTFGPEQARAGDPGLVPGLIRARCPTP